MSLGSVSNEQREEVRDIASEFESLLCRMQYLHERLPTRETAVAITQVETGQLWFEKAWAEHL